MGILGGGLLFYLGVWMGGGCIEWMGWRGVWVGHGGRGGYTGDVG